MSAPTTTTKLHRPSHIARVYKFDETNLLHQRCIELTSNFDKMTALPRVPIHSSMSNVVNPYFIALSELRAKKLYGKIIRDDGTHNINDLKPCNNSY